MATPTYPSQRYYAAGAAKGTTWGTAAATGAAKGLLLLKDGNIALKQKYIPNDEIDFIMTKGGVLGPVEAIEFAPEFAMRYDPGYLGTLIAALFGTAGAPSGSGSIGYTHLFAWADSSTPFYTVAVERPGKIWEVASAKPTKLNIKVANGFLIGTLSMRGNNLIDTSAVNGATQMDAITYIDTGNRIKFSEGVIRMNTASGAALQASDALSVSELEINYERQYDTPYAAGSTGIIEPKESGKPKITVKLKLARFSDYLSVFQAGTAQKMDMTFTGGVIATTYHYAMTLTFQQLVLMTPPDAPLDGIITSGLEFEAQEAAAAPTGMVGVRPSMGLVNLLGTADYLS